MESKCRRCRAETDRQTLADDPLCIDCADWDDEREESRSTKQPALDEWDGGDSL